MVVYQQHPEGWLRVVHETQIIIKGGRCKV